MRVLSGVCSVLKKSPTVIPPTKLTSASVLFSANIASITETKVMSSNLFKPLFSVTLIPENNSYTSPKSDLA